MIQMDLNKLTQETIEEPLTLYNKGKVSLEEMCRGIVQETLNNFGLFEKIYRSRELHSNLSNNYNKNESKIEELLKEKIVIEERLCDRVEYNINGNCNKYYNELQVVPIKKPIELSVVVDKLNEVIKKVNEL